MPEKCRSGLDIKNEALFQFALGNKKECKDLLREACQVLYSQLQTYTCGGSSTCDTRNLSRNLEQCMSLFEKAKSNENLLTKDESLLYLSSKMGDFKNYPWVDEPSLDEFSASKGPFLDTKLYNIQIDGLSWLDQSKTPISGLLDKWEKYPRIYQDAFHDCSVVSSLTSIICLSERCPDALDYPTNYFYPFMKSPSRKYLVKLHINGIERAVEVDDQLFPVENRADGQTSYLFLRCSTAIWPILVEKAYMKVTGGYKFQGSHAALDTFILCGWIPEIIDLNDILDDTQIQKVWERLSRGWKNNDVLACLGTSNDVGRDQDLIPMHDYSIVNVDSTNKMVRVRNPWSENSSKSKEITISFNLAMKKFRFLYFNWNPQLLPVKSYQHFIWPAARLELSLNSSAFISCPQFYVTNKKNEAVIAYFLLQQHNFKLDKPQNIFLGIRLYQGSVRKLHTALEKQEWARSQELDAPYTMLRCEIPPRSHMLAIITARHDSSRKTKPEIGPTTFTFSVASADTLTLERAREPSRHRISERDHWTKECIGGNWADARYADNPQYILKVQEKNTLTKIFASSSTSQPIALHLFVLKKGCTQLYKFDDTALLQGSGQYSSDYCWINPVELVEGEYIVVLSTYGKSKVDMNSFWLEFFSSRRVTVRPIVRERAGMFKRSVTKQWRGGNRLEVSIHSPRLCEIYLDVKTLTKDGNYRPSLRLSVFEGETLVASTKDFSDDASGITLNNLIIQANTVYVIVMERLERGNGSVDLFLYSLESNLVIEGENEP